MGNNENYTISLDMNLEFYRDLKYRHGDGAQTRALETLRNTYSVVTVGDFLNFMKRGTVVDLMKQRNFGVKSKRFVEELYEMLQEDAEVIEDDEPKSVAQHAVDIQEFREKGTNVQLVINAADLREFATYLISQIQAASEDKEEPESYLTPDEVADMIGVSKNTLWRWDKEHYLTPVKVGRKSRYKRSGVIALMSGKNKQP